MMTWIDCTGDACAGDTIKFTEGVFGGSHRRPKYLGDRFVIAKVVKDSYGAAKQQHTFTIVIVESTGTRPLVAGTKTTRKGRNVYRNGCERLPWSDESLRDKALEDKHARGDAARARRDLRCWEEDIGDPRASEPMRSVGG